MNTRRVCLPLIFAAALLFSGFTACTTTTPTTPTTPAAPPTVAAQTNVLNADKLLADTVNGAVKAVIALRDQGKVSQADTTLVENYCAAAAKFSDGLDTIITSTDTWAVQRGKIISLVQVTVLPVIQGKVSPTAAAVVTQIDVLFTLIKGQVGL